MKVREYEEVRGVEGIKEAVYGKGKKIIGINRQKSS